VLSLDGTAPGDRGSMLRRISQIRLMKYRQERRRPSASS
jgi:hypothetical protein